MNADSRSGNAPGFRLSSLNKLVDTKSADNSMTLLHFVASVAESKLKDVLTVTDELADCEGPTKRTRCAQRTVRSCRLPAENRSSYSGVVRVMCSHLYGGSG